MLSRKPCYELDNANENFYRVAMQRLSDALPVWPPVGEQTNAVKKFSLIKRLDTIAKETGSKRPKSHQLTATKPVASQWKNGHWVLKREQSSCSDDVKLLQPGTRPTTKERENFLRGRYPWLVQEFMPLLRSIGEWRIIVIEGRAVCTVFTHPVDGHPVDKYDETVFVLTEGFRSLQYMA